VCPWCSILQETRCGRGVWAAGRPAICGAACCQVPANAPHRALTERRRMVDIGTMFMDCPAYIDERGAVRCSFGMRWSAGTSSGQQLAAGKRKDLLPT